MTSLRKSLLILILFMAFAYNIERLDFGQENLIDIQSFVYVQLLVAVVTMIAIPITRRFSIYAILAFWIAIYFALRLLVFRSVPLIGGLNTYLTMTELFLLIVSIYATYELLKFLGELEAVVERVTFPSSQQRVLRMSEALEDIKTEFIRSRRYNRPLSILLVQPTASSFQRRLQQTVQEIQNNMLNRYLSTSLARLIMNEARRTDLVLEHDQNGWFVVICPETTRDGIQALTSRIKETAGQNLNLTLKIGASNFPDDALTFEEMLQQAELQMEAPIT
ncbi:MAG TPA: hypothetical protein PKM21_07945 [Anaerolineales bacterium]|nr:hypothetical protein [Anaerolineales bacterium]